MANEIEKAGEPDENGSKEKTRSNPLFERLDAWAGDIDDPGRWSLMRDVTVFQGKLALDALRDLALSPVSIVAALVGFFRDKDRPGRYFYPLMRTGRRSDTVINLFGAAQHAGLDLDLPDDPSVDELVKKFEDIVVREYEQGGVTAHAKEALDKAMDKLHSAARREAEHLGSQFREEANKFRKGNGE